MVNGAVDVAKGSGLVRFGYGLVGLDCAGLGGPERESDQEVALSSACINNDVPPPTRRPATPTTGGFH